MIKLSLFTAFTLTVTVALASVIGNFRLFHSDYLLNARFNDATGLLKGDIVSVAGVTVGKVRGVKVERGVAVAALAVDRKVKFPRDSDIEIRYRNLIGQRVVLIKPGKDTVMLAEGQTVPTSHTQGPLDLGSVFNNLRPLLKTLDPRDINVLSTALIESVGGHKQDIDALLANTANTTQTLAGRDQKIASLIGSIDQVASSLADHRTQLSGLLADLAKLTGTVANRSGEVDRTISNLDVATGRFGTLINNNRPGLDQDLKDLATLLDVVVAHQSDLAQITGHLDDTLTATGRGTTYGEWGNLYVYALCSHGQTGCDVAAPRQSFSASGPTLTSMLLKMPFVFPEAAR